MRSALSVIEVVRPHKLDDALEAMSDGDRPIPMAGGTDLFVYLNAGQQEGKRYLDLWGLRELRGVKSKPGGMMFGALTTFRELREHPEVKHCFPSLVAAASEVGGWQIQNRATVAGNIANGSPAGDSLPVLLAHDAVVHVRSLRGSREIAFDELYRGYRDLVLEPDELITSIWLPLPPPRSRTFFRKVGTRRAQSISKVVFSGVLTRDRDGRASHVRLAYGSVAAVPLRTRRAEDALAGEFASPEATAGARVALERDIAPIDDIRSSRDYRLTVAGNVLEQFLRVVDR